MVATVRSAKLNPGAPSATHTRLVHFTSPDFDPSTHVENFFAFGYMRVIDSPDRAFLGMQNAINFSNEASVITGQPFPISFAEVYNPFPEPLPDGTIIELIAGCDRTSGTCSRRYNNIRRYRGLLDIPGTDRANRSARTGV